jgi:hypothetical protein
VIQVRLPSDHIFNLELQSLDELVFSLYGLVGLQGIWLFRVACMHISYFGADILEHELEISFKFFSIAY